MFRQGVSYRWAEGVTDEAKHALRQSLESLRSIPELTALAFGDDARHFDGNYDFVAVMDFPDFTAARRYVADERHLAYIRDHASQVIGARVVVQHDWALADVAGMHHITLPVSDVARTRDWYTLAFGMAVQEEFHEDGHLTNVVLVHPASSLVLELTSDPKRAEAMAGFASVILTVANKADLLAIIKKLDGRAVGHSEPIIGSGGLTVDVPDPDGLIVRLVSVDPADAE